MRTNYPWPPEAAYCTCVRGGGRHETQQEVNQQKNSSKWEGAWKVFVLHNPHKLKKKKKKCTDDGLKTKGSQNSFWRWFAMYCIIHTANNCPFMHSQKYFCQVSLQMSTKHLQNRIIMFCLEFYRKVQLLAYETTYLQTELWSYSSTRDSYFDIGRDTQ